MERTKSFRPEVDREEIERIEENVPHGWVAFDGFDTLHVLNQPQDVGCESVCGGDSDRYRVIHSIMDGKVVSGISVGGDVQSPVEGEAAHVCASCVEEVTGDR